MVKKTMAIIDGFYRELVTGDPNADVSINSVLGRFPVIPSVIYPPFDVSKLEGVKMTAKELAAFIKVINSAYRVYYSNGASNDNFIDYISPLAFVSLYQAKQELGGVFGLDSGSTLFASAIRPITFTAGLATPQQNWNFTVSTAGWNTSFFVVNTAIANTSTPDLNLYNNVTMVIFGFHDASAKLTEVQFTTPAGVKQGVKEFIMNNLPGSTDLLLLDESYYIGKNLRYTIDVNFSGTGTVE
ncbi:MAG: hypothetical protein RXO36_07055, partial [Candidatus Nanopusillus acidilobi]